MAEFSTMAADLLALRDWLKQLSVTHVAMEATGVYWKPVHYALEDDFELLLVNAQHVKNVHALRGELLRRRGQPIPEQGRWLASVLRGHANYYGVPGNQRALYASRSEVVRLWRRALRRRSQRTRLTWARMRRLRDRWLPFLQITHPWPNVRFDARTQGRSPVWQSRSLGSARGVPGNRRPDRERSRTAGMSRGVSSRRCWTAGERVVRVAPQRMAASRKGEREPGKSDGLTLAVARAVVKDGVKQFAIAYLNEQAMEIRLLLDHRQDLVADRTRTVNRLRWHLLELCPELESSLKRGAFNHARVLDRVDRRLRKLPAGARMRIAREQVAQLRWPQPPHRPVQGRAARAGQGAPPQAAGRAGLRRADRRDPDRPHRRQRAVPLGGRLRAAPPRRA
jgi:hypothetical protein